MNKPRQLIFTLLCALSLIVSATTLTRADNDVPDYPGSIDRDFAIDGIKIGMSPQQVIHILHEHHLFTHVSHGLCAKEEAKRMKTNADVTGHCVAEIDGVKTRSDDPIVAPIQVRFDENLPHFGQMIVVFVQAAASLQTPADERAFTKSVLARYPHPSLVNLDSDGSGQAFWCNRRDPDNTACDNFNPDQLLWMCNGGCSYNWLQLEDNALNKRLSKARDNYLASISTGTGVTF